MKSVFFYFCHDKWHTLDFNSCEINELDTVFQTVILRSNKIDLDFVQNQSFKMYLVLSVWVAFSCFKRNTFLMLAIPSAFHFEISQFFFFTYLFFKTFAIFRTNHSLFSIRLMYFDILCIDNYFFFQWKHRERKIGVRLCQT